MPGEGFYKFTRTDGARMAELICSFRQDTYLDYSTIALHCLASVISNGKPCPYFEVSVGEVARECNLPSGGTPASRRSKAQRFFELCERTGYLIRIETAQRGKTPRRAFWWHAEGVSGLTSKPDTPLYRVSGSNPIYPDTKPQDNPIHQNVKTAGQPDTHTETESQRAEGAAGYAYATPATPGQTAEESEREILRKMRKMMERNRRGSADGE